VGRGTRIREKEGKTHFTIMDFRNITRLFADPDWDGPLEVDKGYMPDRAKPYTPPKDKPDDGGGVHDVKPIVNRDGCEVKIINKVVSVYDSNGKLLRTESITDYTKKNINDTYANLNDFILHWNAAERKGEITELMRENGIDLQALKHDQGMDDVDDFDFICHIAYGKKPLTRKERAENVKKRDVFHKYGPEAQKVLEALLDKYMNEGISQLENRKVLTLDPFRQMGSPASIARLFGGNQQYFEAVKELESIIYSDIA
jgi:type I restriction enzyme R subunit